MATAATTKGAETCLRTRVCVVGAGAAGIPLALFLSDPDAANLDVVLLDGSAQDQSCSSDPPGFSRFYDGEQGDFLNSTVADFPWGPDETWINTSRKQTLGGSTNCWGATSIPLQPVDFAPPGLPGLAWPIRREDLDPWYARAIDVIRLGDMQLFDTAYWRKAGHVDPFFGHPDLQTVMAQQGQEPYWKFQCLYRQPLNGRANLHLLQGAHLLGFEVEGDHVAVARARSVQGIDYRIEADYFVLAAGGIENVRLLFNGNLERYPRGLGNNAKGMLGQFFGVHPLISGAALINQPDRSKKPSFGGIYGEDLGQHGPWRASVYPWTAVTPDGMRRNGIGNVRVFINEIGWRQAYGVNVNFQQVSNEASTITPIDATDDFGQRRVKVDWNLTAQDFATVRTVLNLVEAALTKIDPGWTLYERCDDGHGTCISDGKAWYPYGGWGTKGVWLAEHHMGATRMSVDPEEGIVDPDCRVHTTANLFVTGSSVFRQAGFANPTFTIIAMALRLADHLRGLVRGG